MLSNSASFSSVSLSRSKMQNNVMANTPVEPMSYNVHVVRNNLTRDENDALQEAIDRLHEVQCVVYLSITADGRFDLASFAFTWLGYPGRGMRGFMRYREGVSTVHVTNEILQLILADCRPDEPVLIVSNYHGLLLPYTKDCDSNARTTFLKRKAEVVGSTVDLIEMRRIPLYTMKVQGPGTKSIFSSIKAEARATRKLCQELLGRMMQVPEKVIEPLNIPTLSTIHSPEALTVLKNPRQKKTKTKAKAKKKQNVLTTDNDDFVTGDSGSPRLADHLFRACEPSSSSSSSSSSLQQIHQQHQNPVHGFPATSAQPSASLSHVTPAELSLQNGAQSLGYQRGIEQSIFHQRSSSSNPDEMDYQSGRPPKRNFPQDFEHHGHPSKSRKTGVDDEDVVFHDTFSDLRSLLAERERVVALRRATAADQENGVFSWFGKFFKKFLP